MPWTNIYPITPPAAGIRNQWTRAIIRNRLFIYQQGLAFILETDTTVPGTVTMTEHTPTFLNMTAIEGIFQARSRLGAWDTTNAVYWGDTANLIDFEPDLRTRANVVTVDALKGNIITILPTDEGFIIYTTANIVAAVYTSVGQKIFDFIEVSDNLGIFSDYSATIGEDGKHYVWTNGGLYKVTPVRGGVEPVAPEVSDYLSSFEQSPRLSYHLNRYLAIWLHDEHVDAARTVRQRNFLDAATYWRQKLPYDPEFKGDPTGFLTGLNPFGTDFFDNFGYDCYPEIPDKCDADSSHYTLWGMVTQEFPLLELETNDVTAKDMVMDDGTIPTDPVGIPFNINTLTQEATLVDKYTRTPYRLTAATRAAHQRNYTISQKTRYSFDPHELLMYQAYTWQAEDQANDDHVTNNAIMDANQLHSVNHRYQHILKSRDIVPVEVSNTVVVDPDISDDTKTGLYDVSEIIDIAADEIAYVNARILVEENFLAKTRTTIIETITAVFELQPVVTIDSPSTGGSLDGNLISGPTVVVDTVRGTAGPQGLLYLTEDAPNSFFDDANFRNFFQLGVTQEDYIYDDVTNLGFKSLLTDPAPAVGYQVWATGTTINAVSDRCLYGDLRAHPKNRAVTEFKKTSTFNTYLEYQGVDGSGDDVYAHRIEQDVVIDYQRDVLYPEITHFPSADTEIPIRNNLYPIPLAIITRADGALPSAVLQQYYNDSVLEGISVVNVYQNNGWTVATHPGGPFAPTDLLISGGESPNIYNGTDSGSFLEYFLSGLQCSKLLLQGLWPFDIDTTGKFVPLDVPTGPDITIPETIFLTQTGAPGPLYPTYTRALIFDRLLDRWGTADLDFRLFLDFSPINEVTYDPILETAVTRFTYDNFLSRLGALLPNGMLTQFDDQPSDSWIVYGKIGWRRSKMTMMQEVFLEFAENPNANVILESSLDRRTLAPYNMRSEVITRAGHTMYITVTGRWFNIVVRGRYHLTGLEFLGSPLGKE